MAADRTPLGTGIPAIDRDQAAPVPAGLVREHAQQFPPADIGDGFGQAVILQQVFDGQRLDTDHLVLADESGRQLVLEITAAIGDAGMDASDLTPGLLPIPAPLLLLGMAALGTRQALFLLLEEVFVARFLPGRERDHILQPQVHADRLGREWARGRCPLPPGRRRNSVQRDHD